MSWLPEAICVYVFHQNKITTGGNFLWINQSTSNLPATTRSKKPEAALVYGAESISATSWSFGRVRVTQSSLRVSAASCGHCEAKPSCFCKRAKVQGTVRCSTQKTDSQVCELCQVGLIVFLYIFCDKMNPICFIKNVFSWLWKQTKKN